MRPLRREPTSRHIEATGGGGGVGGLYGSGLGFLCVRVWDFGFGVLGFWFRDKTGETLSSCVFVFPLSPKLSKHSELISEAAGAALRGSCATARPQRRFRVWSGVSSLCKVEEVHTCMYVCIHMYIYIYRKTYKHIHL